jgi:hypothetical protein
VAGRLVLKSYRHAQDFLVDGVFKQPQFVVGKVKNSIA